MSKARFEIQEGIGHLIIDNAPFNQLASSVTHDLLEAVGEAKKSHVRVMLLRTIGSDFSLGYPFEEWEGKNEDQITPELNRLLSCLKILEALPFPTIAVVQGRANGGGFELALHCDLIVAADDAKFSFPEVRIGLAPLIGGLQRVASRCGTALAARMCFLAETFSAQELERFGIVTKLVPSNSIYDGAWGIASDLANGPSRAYAMIKATLHAFSDSIKHADDLNSTIAPSLFVTNDAQQGLTEAATAVKNNQPLPFLKFQSE
jgi:enoyl-CoA hydratase/carnithine racemase